MLRGKNVCGGCLYSYRNSGNSGKCPFCKAEPLNKSVEEDVKELMKRVEANDAGATYVLGSYHYHGQYGLHQDGKKATELWTQAAKLGSKQAYHNLGNMYFKGGDLKKAKFHYEAAAMAGHEVARCNLGSIEGNSGNMEQAVKHWTIAASAGHYKAMNSLQIEFKRGYVSRDTINSSLTAYNNSCAEMRSEARDAHIRMFMVDN
jgi:TPR repeat protein